MMSSGVRASACLEKHFNSKNVRLLRRSRNRFRQRRLDQCRADHQVLNKTPLAQHINMLANSALLKFLSSHDHSSYREALGRLIEGTACVNKDVVDVSVMFNFLLVSVQQSLESVMSDRKLVEMVETVYENREKIGEWGFVDFGWGGRLLTKPPFAAFLNDDSSYFSLCVFYSWFKYVQTDIGSALSAIDELSAMIETDDDTDVCAYTAQCSPFAGSEFIGDQQQPPEQPPKHLSIAHKSLVIQIRFLCKLKAGQYEGAIADYKMLEHYMRSGNRIDLSLTLFSQYLQLHLRPSGLESSATSSKMVRFDHGLVTGSQTENLELDPHDKYRRVLQLMTKHEFPQSLELIRQMLAVGDDANNLRSLVFPSSSTQQQQLPFDLNLKLKRVILLLRQSECQLRLFRSQYPFIFGSEWNDPLKPVKLIRHHRTQSLVVKLTSSPVFERTALIHVISSLKTAINLMDECFKTNPAQNQTTFNTQLRTAVEENYKCAGHAIGREYFMYPTTTNTLPKPIETFLNNLKIPKANQDHFNTALFLYHLAYDNLNQPETVKQILDFVELKTNSPYVHQLCTLLRIQTQSAAGVAPILMRCLNNGTIEIDNG